MPTVWDKYWKETKFDKDYEEIQKLSESLVWKKLNKELKKHFKNYEKLDVIELGSGRGTTSLLFGINESNITLVDESKEAIKEAKILYSKFKINPKLINKNLFELDKKKKYDIVISFGLAEHFEGKKRKEIWDIHYNLLKKKGIAIISVPNKRCYPYMIYKKLAELFNKWKYGLEIPYSRKEIFNLTKDFEKRKIIGSSFINSIYHFLYKKIIQVLFRKTPKDRFLKTKSFLDNYFGYALIFIGKK